MALPPVPPEMTMKDGAALGLEDCRLGVRMVAGGVWERAFGVLAGLCVICVGRSKTDDPGLFDIEE